MYRMDLRKAVREGPIDRHGEGAAGRREQSGLGSTKCLRYRRTPTTRNQPNGPSAASLSM